MLKAFVKDSLAMSEIDTRCPMAMGGDGRAVFLLIYIV
jgi:hypothetical protein